MIFKGPNAPTAGTQFKPAVLAADGRAVYVQNLNQDSKKYEYKIRVYKKGSTGPGLESPDPAIINDF